MRALLVAVNSKFIHSAYGIYCIKSYGAANGVDMDIAEYTINNNEQFIIQDIYKRKPEIIGFSCYIWNVDIVFRIVKNIKKVLPETKIFLGGPEVSYNGEEVMRRNLEVDYIVLGEGEERVCSLIKGKLMDGIIYRNDEELVIKEPNDYLDLSKTPFVYDYVDIDNLKNKIVYYESSRGCPYRCSYCLSSVDKKIRYVPVERVLKDLRFFLEKNITQVKFIDRTFNCDKQRTKQIWKYLKENDNGVTNFHFEISVDILDEETLELLREIRPGYFQFEIGVQTTNIDTIKAINRNMNFEKVKENVKKINTYQNIHQHLDLIAGLPLENYKSFRNSFNDVYALKPEQLQLGFLKVIKGTIMRQDAEKHRLVYREEAPYEILYTKYIGYEDMLKLKNIEEMVEIYYNSGRFRNVINYLEDKFDTPFDFYESLAEYWKEKNYEEYNHSEIKLYEIIYEYSEKIKVANDIKIKELIKLDIYLHSKPNKLPRFIDNSKTEANKEKIYEFYKNSKNIEKYLPEYKKYDSKQISRMAHIEYFSEEILIFNYERRDKIMGKAIVEKIEI